MSRHTHFPLLLVVLALGSPAADAATFTVDFEEVASGTTASIESQGFRFTSSFGIFGPQDVTATDGPLGGNNTRFLDFCTGCTLTIERVDGNTFDLLSFDLFDRSPGSNNFSVTGTFPVGPGLQSAFLTTTDFLNYNVQGTFVSVQAIVISGAGSEFDNAIDNVTLAAVPLPAAAWSFTAALGLLGWQRRRRRVRL